MRVTIVHRTAQAEPRRPNGGLTPGLDPVTPGSPTRPAHHAPCSPRPLRPATRPGATLRHGIRGGVWRRKRPSAQDRRGPRREGRGRERHGLWGSHVLVGGSVCVLGVGASRGRAGQGCRAASEYLSVWCRAASLPQTPAPAKGLLQRSLRKENLPVYPSCVSGCLSVPTSDLDVGVTARQAARTWALGGLPLAAAAAAWRGKPGHEGPRVSGRGRHAPTPRRGEFPRRCPA